MSADPRRREILDALVALARLHLGVDGKLDEEQRLVEDLAFDSLKLLTLAAEVENRFAFRIEPDEEAAIVTIGDLVDLVGRKRADRGRPDAPPATGAGR
ncbi:MAG: acyl carrier protein [Thermoanaerobaculia bacterium]